MKFNYSKEQLSDTEKKIQRLFEMVPGLLSWSILLFLIVLSILKPLLAMVVILAFDFYWLLRLLYMTIFLVLSFGRLRIESKADWMKRIKAIENIDQSLKDFNKLPSSNFNNRLSDYIHKQEMLNLKKSGTPAVDSKSIYHLVILPVAKEPKEVLIPSVESLKGQTFPIKQIMVFLTVEETAPGQIKTDLLSLENIYKNYFLDFKVMIHPTGLKNEAQVKGANASWAAKKAAQFFKTIEIPFENITVSCFDADTIVGKDYFACLTYYFMVTPQRLQASFQPIPVYHNNIWDVPGFARIIETGSSFFQMIESSNPEKLVTFSSHSMSFKALVDINYWPTDMISDDSAIFWKSFIHYDGKFSVIPMYITVSMDITSSKNLLGTIKSVYKQKRRWAWGAENFPIVMRAFISQKGIPLFSKVKHGFKLLESHVSWATWGFILTILSWLPTFLAKREITNSIVYYNAPYISRMIFHLASISLIISIILSLLLLPKKKIKNSFLKKTLFALEWLMMPLILMFLSTLPALDAQTRLLFGKRMKFWVANKRKA